MQQRNVDLYDR